MLIWRVSGRYLKIERVKLKQNFMKKMYETRLIRIKKLCMCKTCQRFIIGFKKIQYIDFVSYVCIIISYVHFSELQIRQAFSCPRPILILNLEVLLFCFDKHEMNLT